MLKIKGKPKMDKKVKELAALADLADALDWAEPGRDSMLGYNITAPYSDLPSDTNPVHSKTELYA